MLKRKIAAEPIKGVRGLDRVQVLALDVLNERQFEHLRLCHFLNHDRHFGQSGYLGCAPTAFARHHLVLPVMSAHDQWLDDAICPD